jgi:DNA transposition AAA+ family ATPase
MTSIEQLDFGSSSPPSRASTSASAKTAPPKNLKPIDTVLRSKLEAHMAARNLSQKQVGSLIGYSESALNRWMNPPAGSKDKFHGDVEKLEGRIRGMLYKAELRAKVKQNVEPFPTLATRRVKNYINTIFLKPQIGLIHGEAGTGKTTGVVMFMDENPDALLVTMSQVKGNGCGAILHELWKTMDTRGYKRRLHGSPGAYVIDQLAGSNRPLIIDNAHRMTPGARKWVCDFHDETGCPVILVGNPEVVDAFRTNDQQFSRIGFKGEVALVKRSGEDKEQPLQQAVEQFLERVWPEAASRLFPLAMEVARNHGHLRALWHQLSLAQHLHTEKAKDCETPIKAFRAAHAQLVRNYELAA